MAVGIQKNEPNARIVYADIIDLPRWEPKPGHPKMDSLARAAQFAPFAALSGYGEMIDEESRLVDQKIELTEEEWDSISQKLNILNDAITAGNLPTAKITYFVPDPLKPGGKYETVTERVRRVDAAHQKVILAKTAGYAGSYVEIDMRNILEIQSEVFVSFS